MSRIHEALKKAEQDRAAVQASDPIALSAHPAAPARISGDDASATANDVLVGTSVVAPLKVDYLRFDDLRVQCAHPSWHLDPNTNVFFNSDTGSHGAEQFRTLRSRLYQLRASSNQPLRSLLVTSAIPAEGKTFVASNLAQAIIRQPDRRVLLIDADLRCPRLHVQLGAPLAPGLTDYLRGEADEMAVIQHGQEGGLCLIAGGNEVRNPSELLSNGRLKGLLDRVTPVFDWVILDSPPCLPVADANVLADLCDGVLLVVRAGTTPSAVAQKACQQLQGRTIAGVVLNAVEEAPSYGSYYYYGHGYGSSEWTESRK
jgi:protein-tyrosine kinase